VRRQSDCDAEGFDATRARNATIKQRQRERKRLAAAKLQARRQAQLTRLLDAAIARGELRRGTDLGLVLDLLGGMIHVRRSVKKNARRRSRAQTGGRYARAGHLTETEEGNSLV
jgi:Tetracyclin repressor-like, C-terminal domain